MKRPDKINVENIARNSSPFQGKRQRKRGEHKKSTIVSILQLPCTCIESATLALICKHFFNLIGAVSVRKLKIFHNIFLRSQKVIART